MKYATYTPSEHRENLESVWQNRDLKPIPGAFIIHLIRFVLFNKHYLLKHFGAKHAGIIEQLYERKPNRA